MECFLELEDGTRFTGISFGSGGSVSGEVVFNTGMTGYPEAMTDPSYRGQILVLTYPLIGNYGVPDNSIDEFGLERLESARIQVTGLVVAELSDSYSHWEAKKSLHEWMVEHNIPGIKGIDTRALTKKLREKGVMLGRIVCRETPEFSDPNKRNLVAEVSVRERKVYNEPGSPRILLIDCGVKNNIIRSALQRGCSVTRVPWDFDFTNEEYDAIIISNGPGDPKMCAVTIEHIRKALEGSRPILGICLGNQLIALAAGADTYKLKYGHRSQNQPCIDKRTGRCYITTQNHGFAVDTGSLPKDWQPWFYNANDGTNEGMLHKSRPFMSVQFHPEATPGPVDTNFIFDEFLSLRGKIWVAKKSM